MSLLGLDPIELTPLQRSLYRNHLSAQREAKLLELIILVNSIREMGARLAGQDPGNGVTDALKTYKELLFPELREETESKAKKTKDILKEEFERGPLQVQALSYGKSKPKKPRQKRK